MPEQYNSGRPGRFRGIGTISRTIKARRKKLLPWEIRRGIQQRGYSPDPVFLTFNDAYALAEGYTTTSSKTTSDAYAITEAIASKSISKTLTDVFTGADAVPSRQAATSKADAFASSDGTTITESELLTINDTFTISDAATTRGVKLVGTAGADAFAISEALILAMVNKSFTDAFAVTDILTNKFVSKATGDAFALGDSQVQYSSDILNFTDNFLLSDSFLVSGVKTVGVSDTFGIGDSLDTLNLRTQLIFDDAFAISDAGGVSSSLTAVNTDTFTVTEFADGLPAPPVEPVPTPPAPSGNGGVGAVSKPVKPKRTKRALTFADSFMLMDSTVIFSSIRYTTGSTADVAPPVVGLEKPAREIYNSASNSITHDDLVELLMTGVI